MTTTTSQSIKGKIQTFRTQDNGYSHTRYTRFGIRESTGWQGTSLHTWQRSWTYESITHAKETKNNISLYPVFILLPTSITDWDIESGRTSRYQLMALGIRHLLDRVPLTGPTSRQLLWVWSTWFIQSKVPIESHQRPTPFLLCLTGWTTKQVSKCYSVIAVNKVSTSFFISYHLSCIPTIIPLVTALTSAKWFCENINRFTQNVFY